MKKILVLGGGFAGVAALLKLLKETKDTELILVDQQKFHLFTPSLYEVATSEEPQQNIAIPFEQIFKNKVKFVQGKVAKIEQDTVILENGQVVDSDYLIVALGSESAYFGIKGLQEHSLDLKTLAEAVAIKNKIKEVYEKNITLDKPTNVVVGGGGFSGTEVAAELITFRERLAKLYKKPKDLLAITVIEGAERLLNSLNPRISTLAQKKLEKGNVKIYLNTFIQEVFENKLVTKNGQEMSFDVLLWTGGVAASPVLVKSNFEVNKRGQVEVDEFLRIKGKENIFAVGDLASYTDPKTNKPAPGVAQVAEEEGWAAGENVALALAGKPLKPYKLRHFGYVVPLKGKYAVADLGLLKLEGVLAWLLQQFVLLRYLLGILPLGKALTRWNKFELELEQG